MRYAQIVVLLILAALLSLGSASSPSQEIVRRTGVAEEVTSGKVAVGMSTGEVEQLLGRPEEFAAEEGDELWRYFKYDIYSEREAVSTVRFRHGQVVSFDSIPIRAGIAAVPAPALAPMVDLPGGQNDCRSGIDCDHESFCRDRGDGLKVCMGSGGHGAFCRSGVDCAAGHFCKRRSDGYKVCMGEGPRGSACRTSIDCGTGMFCKDRGDGFKVCM